MLIEDVLARFEGVKQSGARQWMARCPAHGDRNPSLSISEGADGKVLLHCFAGCSVDEVCGAVGLKVGDLMPEKKVVRRVSARREKRDLGRHVCDYVYQDVNGEALYKIARYMREDGSKSFVHLRPDSESKFGWSFGIHDKGSGELLVRYRVPFRLPRVVEAARAGRVIFVLEGEKDVLNFENATGCCATCNSGGALKWGEDFPQDWVKWFDGAKGVVVIADNDPEFKVVERVVRGKVVKESVPHWKGQKHAVDVRNKFVRAGFPADKIKLMVLPDVGGVGVKDFSEWMAAREALGFVCDREAVLSACREAAAWPGVWEFSEEVLSSSLDVLARAKRLEKRAVQAGDVQLEASSGVEEVSATGRFGVLVPCDPLTGIKRYRVNYIIGRNFAGEVQDVEIVVGSDDVLPMAIASWFGVVGERLRALDRKMGSRERNDVAALVCLLWLRARGKFFWDKNDVRFDTSLYFDEGTGVLMYIRRDEFMSFLATASCINRESIVFKFVMSLVDDAALSAECSQGVVPSKLWECRGERIYLSCGDSEMYRVSAGKVERCQNGTDGVVFLRKNTLREWSLCEGDGLDPFVESLIFKGACFEDERLGRMVVRLWFLNLFRVHRMKPPLLITGLFQSGKTRMAVALKEILGLDDMSVQEAEDGDKGLDAFWATVNAGMFEIYDNLDTRIKWVPNTLQVAATNGQTKRRTLYTTFGVSVLKANAHLVITSNNPLFATELGLADRLQIVRLGRARKVSSDLALSKDIEEKRNEFMTWTARVLAKALADREPVEDVYNMRHPEFSTFSVRLGRVLGCVDDVIGAMKKAELEKSLLPLQDENGLPIQILRVLIDKNGVWKFTSAEMAQAIVARMSVSGEADEKTASFVNARKVGKALNANMLPFSTLFKVLPRKMVQGTPTYTFAGIMPGVDFKVGLVGLESRFPESPMQNANIIDFSGNDYLNSPNTPEEENEEDYFL